MHFGHTTTLILARKCTFLLTNSWRLALSGILFALTCWEVNPGQMPMPETDSVKIEASVVVAEGKAGQTNRQW